MNQPTSDESLDIEMQQPMQRLRLLQVAQAAPVVLGSRFRFMEQKVKIDFETKTVFFQVQMMDLPELLGFWFLFFPNA